MDTQAGVRSLVKYFARRDSLTSLPLGTSKSSLHASAVDTAEEELLRRVQNGYINVRYTPHIFQRILQSTNRWAEACVEVQV
jgi:hypothetical protein